MAENFKFVPRNTGFTDLISIAVEVVKRDAYEYVTSKLDSHRMVDDFEQFLFEETEKRDGLWTAWRETEMIRKVCNFR